MALKGILPLTFHALVWLLTLAFVLWATGASAGRAPYDTATPHSPSNSIYHSSYNNHNQHFASASPNSESIGSRISPSELILAGLRTVLDVVRNINKKKLSNKVAEVNFANATSIQLRRRRIQNDTSEETGRGFEDYYDEHHYHDHDTTTTTVKPMKQGRYTDPWAGYYDWVINEGSFKFWSVFQLFTAALLLYACFSAIYYAKFNPIIPDYSLEYDDYFLERTVGRNARSVESWELPSGLTWMNARTFQFILDAISNYSHDQ